MPPKGASVKKKLGKSKNNTQSKKTATKATKAKPAQRKSGRGKGKKEESEDKVEEGSDEEGEDDKSSDSVVVKWTNDQVSSMISNIHKSKDMRQGLFPSPGANVSTQNGGGKKKAAKSIATAQDDRKLKKEWKQKINNKLKWMVKTTLKHMKMMGKTGKGILAEDEINLAENNSLTNTWSKVKADCPWFFEMKALIAQCPNLIPIGLGNAQSDIDITALQTSGSNDTEEPSNGRATSQQPSETASGLGDYDTSTFVESSDGGLLGESEPEELQEDLTAPKRKAPAIDTNVKPKIASGDNKKAIKDEHPYKKPKTNDFAAILQAEEVTKQKEIELEQARLEANTKVQIETSKAALAAKVELEKQKMAERQAVRDAKAKLQMEVMRMKHELEMAKLTQGQTFSPQITPQITTQVAGNSGLLFDSYTGAPSGNTANGSDLFGTQ